MKLFEVTNGYIGESYVRVYVLAATEEEARDAARASYEAHGHAATTLHVRLLLDVATAPGGFCTLPSDSGWDV